MKQSLIWSLFNLVAGDIPPNIGYCQNLTYFDVSFNNLHGSIPSSIGDLKELQTLYFYENQLTGKLCDNQTQIVKSKFDNKHPSCKPLESSLYWCATDSYHVQVHQLRHMWHGYHQKFNLTYQLENWNSKGLMQWFRSTLNLTKRNVFNLIYS